MSIFFSHPLRRLDFNLTLAWTWGDGMTKNRRGASKKSKAQLVNKEALSFWVIWILRLHKGKKEKLIKGFFKYIVAFMLVICFRSLESWINRKKIISNLALVYNPSIQNLGILFNCSPFRPILSVHWNKDCGLNGIIS